MNKKNQFNKLYINIDCVIVNRVHLYKNRSTIQSQTITGNCCTHVIWMNTMMT